MKLKKLLCLFLAIMMVAATFPAVSAQEEIPGNSAQEEQPLQVETDVVPDSEAGLLNEPTGVFNLNEGAILVEKGASGRLSVTQNNVAVTVYGYVITIKGTFDPALTPLSNNEDYVIQIKGTPICNLTLEDVSINVSNSHEQSKAACAMALTDGANVTLTLKGENYLESKPDRAGIESGENEKLTINGSGSLTAIGRGRGAGIGVSNWGSCGEIKIISGHVTAKNLEGSGSGIGGMDSYDDGSVSITGENTYVYAYSSGKAINHPQCALGQIYGKGSLFIGQGATVKIEGGSIGTVGLTIGKAVIEDTAAGDFEGVYSPVTVTGGTASVADRPPYWATDIVKSGTTVTLEPTSQPKVWEEGSWALSSGLELGENNSFTMPDEAVTATYTKTNKTYDITYENLGGATHSNPSTYQYGTPIILEPAGYRTSFAFVDWTNKDGESVTGIAANEYGDKTFYAKWKPVFAGKDPQLLLDRGSYMIDYGAAGITVRVFDNMADGIDGQPVQYRATVTDTNSGEKVINEPRTEGGYTEFCFDFGNGISKLQSSYLNGEYQAVYTIKVEAFIGEDYTKPPFITTEAKGYLLPPVVTVSLDGEVPAIVPAATGQKLAVPFIIENLSTAADGTIGYEVLKNGSSIVSGKELASSSTTPDEHGIQTVRGVVEVPLDTPANMEDVYTVVVTGRNSGQTASTYSRQIKVVDPSLSHLTATYINSANQSTVLTEPSVQGASLAQLAALTAAEAYDSEEAYEYLLANRLGNNRLTLDAPKAWGRVRYRVGEKDFSAWMSPAAAYALTYRQGASTSFTFEWEHSRVKYTLAADNDSLAEKVYLIKLAKGFDDSIFRWKNGESVVQKIVSPTAEGIYVLYAPNGITNLEITGIKGATSYSATIKNPASLSFEGSGSSVSRLQSLSTSADYRNSAPYLTSSYANLVSNPGVRLSFVEHNGAPLTGSVDVNFFVVDKDFKPVETDLAGSSGEVTVASGGFAAIGIQSLTENKTNLILAEIIRTDKKPMLYMLDYQTVSALTGENQQKDVLIKLALPRENGTQLSMQPAILRDESGTRVLYGSASVAADFFDGKGASYSVIVPQAAVSGSLTSLKLETGTLISLKQTAAVVLDSTTLPPLKNAYVMATYDLKDRFAKDQTHTNIRLVDGSNTVASFVGLVSRSVSDSIIDLLNDSFTLPILPAFNFDSLKGLDGLGSFAGAINDFEIETPSWGPISFAVSKEDDCYVIKGVASASALPDSGEDAIESASEILAMFTSISNQFAANQGSNIEISDTFLRPMGGGDGFIGFRLFLSIRATLNKETGFWDFEFNDGGVIGELSGSVTSRNRIAGIAEFVTSMSGKAVATVSFAYPTAEYRARATGIPLMDFAIEAELAAALSARVGVGLDIWIASAYVGIQGGAGASYKNKAISRPYLPSDDPEWLQAGMVTSLNGEISLYVTKQFLFFSQTDTYTLLKANHNSYDPNDWRNPYKPVNGRMASMSTGLVPVNAGLATLGLADSGSLILGVDATAAAQYAAGDILYKDIGDVANLNDDRIKSKSGDQTVNSAAIGPEYSLSVSTGKTNALAAWETIKDGVVNAEEKLDTPEAINRYLAKTEVIGAYYNGSSWQTTQLSNNDMMDMAPKTAYNETANRGIVVWTRGDATATQGEGANAQVTVSGELVCSLFDGTGFSAPITLRSLPQSEAKQVVAVTPAVAGDGSSVVLLQTADGQIGYVTISADGQTVRYVDPGIAAQGADIIWNGEKLVLGYVTADSEANGLVLLTRENGQDAFAATEITNGLEDRIGAGFRFVRDLDKVGMDALAIVWHEFVNGGTQFMGAMLTGEVGAMQVSAPQALGTAQEGYTVASFDACFDQEAKTVSVLTVYSSQGSTIVTEVSDTLENKVKAMISSVDAENLRPGRTSDITLIVQNDGLVPMTGIEVTIDENGPVSRTVDIAQGTSAYVTVPYTPTDAAPLPADLSFTVEATYEDGGTATFTGTHNLYMVDVAVSLLDFSNTENQRSVMVNVAGVSDLVLQNDSKVKLGVYSDPYGEEAAGEDVMLVDINSMMGTGLVQSLNIHSVSKKTQLYVIASVVDGVGKPVRDVNQANNQVRVLVEPNGGSSGVTEIQLSDETVSLSKGKTHLLTATVTPENAANAEVIWSSGNPAVASVTKDGMVTAVSSGSTVITAASADGSAFAQCQVRVYTPVIDFNAEHHTVFFDSQGGTAVADQAVEPGQAATAPKSPVRAGYVFTGWYLDAACSNKYDFAAPVTAALTLYAGWQKGAEEVADPFSDIQGHWANQVIHALYEQGIITGYQDGTFRPQSNVTRAEFAVLLCRALKLSPSDTQMSLFGDDASIPSWARAEIYLCKEWGIMQGDQNGRVNAGQLITRQDMFVMVSRMLTAQGKLGAADAAELLALYGDGGNVAGYAALHIEALLQAGLIQGSDGKLNPAKGSTRAETAQLLFNLLDLV